MHISARKGRTSHIYSLCGHMLDTVSENPYLGLQISEDLKWNKHIANIINKASTVLGLLKRKLKFLPKHNKNMAYKSLVGSVLEYGSMGYIWDPYIQHDIESLERVQRRAARFTVSNYSPISKGFMTQTLKELKLPPLQQRRLYNRLCFFYKISNGLVSAVISSDYAKPLDNKRRIKTKKFVGYVSENPVSKLSRNNSKCFMNTEARSAQYKNSFFCQNNPRLELIG